MVESALFFVVGFLCATFLALMAAPAISQRARRLANARARLQAPLSESQARAERDALRAIQAVEIVRMEKKVAAAEWERAVARTDLARETSRRLKVEAAVEEWKQEVEFRDDQNARLQVAVAAAEAESGAKDTALLDLFGQRDAAQRRLVEARATIADLQVHVDRDRVEIATLATQVSALEVELSDARQSRRRFGESGAGIEERLRLSDAARDDQTLELARLLRTVAERNAALARIESARDELERRLDRARATEGELRAQLQNVHTERAAAQGALMSERDARHHLQGEMDALKARLEETVASSETLSKGDAALRLAIAKLGRDLVRARAPLDEEPHGAGQIVSFARREPTG